MAFLRTWSQYSFWNVLLWQGLLRMISPGSGMRGLKWKCRHIPQRERGEHRCSWGPQNKASGGEEGRMLSL